MQRLVIMKTPDVPFLLSVACWLLIAIQARDPAAPSTRKCRNELVSRPSNISHVGTEPEELFEYEQFLKIACVNCLLYTQLNVVLKSMFMPCGVPYADSFCVIVNNETVFLEADWLNNDTVTLMERVDPSGTRKWRMCCENAKKCCDKQLETASMTAGLYCPQTWDGWNCWDYTPVGEVAFERCPSYASGSDISVPVDLYASKTCWQNGSWLHRQGPHGNWKEWTNYTECDNVILQIYIRRITVRVVSFSISIAALVPAVIIFFSYKQLQCHRITLHKNLFLSFIISGIVFIVYETVIILDSIESDDPIKDKNLAGCKIMLVFTKYCRICNYMWMFCEGYYLHKLIASAFHEQKNLLVFYALGWGFPVIPVLIYSILRATLDDVECWIPPNEPFEWVLNIPCLLSLIVNMCFLVKIIYVLVTKIRGTHASEPSQYRKAVRATLVLIPLFGIHFFITIYRPGPGSGYLEVYNIINCLLDGLQGFLVALIFCYVNGEVCSLLKRSIDRKRLHFNISSQRPDLRSMSMSTHATAVTSDSSRSKANYNLVPNKQDSIPMKNLSTENGAV